MTVSVLTGDCLDVLQSLDANSVRCCVTSPPYFGLRDYGHAGQIGLEPTPDEYVAKMVAVFGEVRRVLKDDGTLWLNLGDSYASSGGERTYGSYDGETGRGPGARRFRRTTSAASDESRAECRTGDDQTLPVSLAECTSLAPKNLIGIPWRVAFALQAPQYNGIIKREVDRIWLAAMLDAEGCLFIHKRKAGQSNGQGYERQNDNYAPGVEISNTHRAIVERVAALVGRGSICEQEGGKFGRKQTLYRWNLRTTESRDFVREIYPYLVAKQQQARILCGCPSSGERAEAAHAALMGLHRGVETAVDFPSPASMFGPGWYLRSDIIWSKSNPMPESVTDRPTKAHEYLFLLSKQERYYYDADAVKEDAVKGAAGSEFHTGKTGEHQLGRASTKPRQSVARGGFAGKTEALAVEGRNAFRAVVERRNRWSVWTVATQPYSGAHFATFPPALIEPCILAGSRVGDTVLDPFGGAGTTGLVADRLSRNALLIEINPAYAEMARKRIFDDSPLFGGAA